MSVRNRTPATGLYAAHADIGVAYDRRRVARALAAYLIAKGWRYRRGSSAPWLEPVSTIAEIDQQRDELAGYSLLGAASRQVELEGARRA